MSADSTIDTTKMPYTVEVDDRETCPHCGSKRVWNVVGPDGVALGVSFGDKEDANEVADDLSRAYLAGAQAALKTLRA
jgi:DNA-directed RNA polymerase subunit RPC12/RpoP